MRDVDQYVSHGTFSKEEIMFKARCRLHGRLPTAIVTLSLLVIVTLSLLTMGRWRHAEADADLLELVKVGCRQAVTAVSSGKGMVTVHHFHVTAPDGPVYETETTYNLAFAGDRYRLSTRTTVLRNDQRPGVDAALMRPVGSVAEMEIAVEGDDVTWLEKRGTQNLATRDCSTSAKAKLLLDTAVSDVQPGIRPGGARLGKGLIDIGKLRTAEIPLFSHVSMKVIGRETIDGSECIVVQEEAIPSSSDRPTSTFVFWVDPQKGYAIPKMRAFVQGGGFAEPTLVLEETVQLKEYKPGIWYPARVTQDLYSTKDPAKHYKDLSKVITYDPNFQVNVPVGEAELSLDLPSGTTVHDKILGTTYMVP